MRGRRWWRWGLELAIVAAVLFAVHAYTTRHAVSGRAPELSAPALQADRPASLAAFEGRPVLIHFWASWCPVCRFEERGIDALARDYPVITVAMQSGDARQVREYLRERDLDFTVVVDQDGGLAREYGVTGVPTSFVVDGAGMIRFVEAGYTTRWGLALRLWWAGL